MKYVLEAYTNMQGFIGVKSTSMSEDGCFHENDEDLVSLFQFAEICSFRKFSHTFCSIFLAFSV